MKEPNRIKAHRIKDLQEKVEILGNTVMTMHQEISFMRGLFGKLSEKGLFDDLDNTGAEE